MPSLCLCLIKGFHTTLLFAIFIFLLPSNAQAQSSTSTARTPGTPAGSYHLGDADTINLFNGNLNYSLPLVRIGGRGETQAGIGIVIEGQWDRRQVPIDPQGNFRHEYSFRSPVPIALVGSVRLESSFVTTDQPCGGSGSYNVEFRMGIVYAEPDGTERAMRDAFVHGLPFYLCGGGGSQNLGRIFESTSGDFVTYVNDTSIYSSCTGIPGCTNAIDGYLYFRDGKKSRVVGGQIRWTQDRNGNKIEYIYQAGRLIQIKDPLDRAINIAYDVEEGVPYGRCTKFTFQGFAGQQKVIRISMEDAGSESLLRATQPYDSIRSPIEIDDPNDNVILGGGTIESHDYVKAIWLPNNRSYQFKYNILGQLARVDLPTGGAIEYDFEDIFHIPFDPFPYPDPGPQGPPTNRVSEKRTYDSNNTLIGRTVFSTPTSYTGGVIPPSRGGVVRDVEVFEPGGSRLTKSRHYFYGTPNSIYWLGVPWWHGREFRTETFAQDGSTILRVGENTWVQRAPSWCTSAWPCYSNPAEFAPTNSPFIVEKKSTLADGNLVTKTSSINPSNQSWAFDNFNNQTDVWQYDYGVGQPGAVLKHVQTSYINNANPLGGIYLLGLTSTTNVYGFNASGQESLASSSQVFYDESQYPLLTYTGMPGWQDPGAIRGNPTTIRNWVNTTGAYLQTHAQYDQAGSLRNAWDANGNQSQIEYSSVNAYAYPTLTRTPVPSPEPLVETSVYDFNSGFVISSTDANGQTTTYEYNDQLDRLTRVNLPDGGRTTYIYVDAHQCGAYVETRTLLDSSGREADSFQFFDGLARPKRAFTFENQDTNNPYLTVDTQYDAIGRVAKVSNPYRSAGCLSTVNPSGNWTRTMFDTLGRRTQVTTADNATVTTEYNGNAVTVTDQAGRKRRSVTDGLGRLTRVDEPNKDTGNLDVGGESTSYTYDVLGNLRKVVQGVQKRFFMFDSLGRLLRAKNPEQGNFTPDSPGGFPAMTDSSSGTSNSDWSMGYLYDANGNLTKRKDARNIVTSYAYDGLNRNTTVDHSDTTGINPDITRIYDTATNGKGRLRESYFGGSETVGATVEHVKIQSYDALGRPLQQQQRFKANSVWSPVYQTQRTYDLAGHVNTQTYPSGHSVAYNYDIAGRSTSFSGNLGDGVTRTYATGITYSTFGGVEQEQFGTQTPLYHKLHYNIRGQMFDVRLSTVPWATDQWDWNRGCIALHFGYPHQQSGPFNNGNVSMMQHWAPTNNPQTYNFTEQRYAYDYLNRLKSVAEFPGTQSGLGPMSFTQIFDYDRWGNRTINSATTDGMPEKQFTASVANDNRLGVPAGYSERMDYDAAGNLVNDTYTSFGSTDGTATRLYDAENRLTTAKNASLQVVRSYSYNADGQRTRRKEGSVETWQVHGMDGELLAEYMSGAAPFVATKEYGYRNGELLVTVSSGDDQRLKRFLQAAYYGALQVDAPSQWMTDKTNELAAAGVQSQAQLLVKAKEIIRALFVQTNYETNPSRSDTQYVTDLYYAYGQRGPDTSGLGWWVPQAAGGVQNRINVLNAWEASGEFLTLVSTLYGTSTSDNERTEHFVNNFYLAAYGVNATPTQLQQQRDSLNAEAAKGQSYVQTQAETMGRALFAGQVSDSSISNTQYVTNLYEGFLQRGPDAGGLSFWSGQANVGQGRQNVLSQFATCPPFRELAGTLYREAYWLVADQLGTPRMVVNKLGSLASVKRHDYLPFGEELFALTGGRTDTQGYTADSVRQKFTQKERDSETGLDYFLARYYSSKQGRFTSPDEFTGGPDELYSFADDASANPTFYAVLSNPQSLNKYAYTYGNPLRYVDPDGHCPLCSEDTVNVKIAIAKGIANIFIGMNNVSASFGIGEYVEPYKPTNYRQAQAMVVTEDVAFFASLGKGKPQVGGVLVAQSKTPAQVAAMSAANEVQMLPKASRPGAAGALVSTKGEVVTATTRSRDRVNAGVQSVLDKIPASQQSSYHGKCCEPRLISKAQDAGITVTGATISVVKVRPPGDPSHGSTLNTCPSCRAVLEFYGIKP